MSCGDLSEVKWRILRVLLPVEREPGKRGRGRPPEDNRNIINGILWRLRTGAPWRDVPKKYGNWNSIYRRFRRWGASGVWESVVSASFDNRFDSEFTASGATARSAAATQRPTVQRVVTATSRVPWTHKSR
ncbi:MAG: transposase [Xanthobacteraceae bacterium]